jgi:hypothetical protein
MRSFAAAVVLALTLGVPSVRAQEKPWQWFAAISLIDEWELEKGTAKVVLTDTTFSAELYIGTYLRHRITGTRQGNNLRVRLSTNETDRVDYPLVGIYQRRNWKNFPTAGREAISFSSGGLMVGFTREIDK